MSTESASKRSHSTRSDQSESRDDKSAVATTSSTDVNERPASQYCVPLTVLNPYITCFLCNGYFIDALTVMDCLHTFCKSCLLIYFEENSDCPSERDNSREDDCLMTFNKMLLSACHVLIHQSHPSHYVSYDRTLQEIVYKLVPGLQQEEQRRRQRFVEEKKLRRAAARAAALDGSTVDVADSDDDEEEDEDEEEEEEEQPLAKSARRSTSRVVSQSNGVRNGADRPCSSTATVSPRDGDEKREIPAPSSTLVSNGKSSTVDCCSTGNINSAHRRHDPTEIIELAPADLPIATSVAAAAALRPFIRLSVFATITTLKRALAWTLRRGDSAHYNDFDIFCNNELMGRDFSLLFIRKTRWRDHASHEPIRLVYKLHTEF